MGSRTADEVCPASALWRRLCRHAGPRGRAGLSPGSDFFVAAGTRPYDLRPISPPGGGPGGQTFACCASLAAFTPGGTRRADPIDYSSTAVPGGRFKTDAAGPTRDQTPKPIIRRRRMIVRLMTCPDPEYTMTTRGKLLEPAGRG